MRHGHCTERVGTHWRSSCDAIDTANGRRSARAERRARELPPRSFLGDLRHREVRASRKPETRARNSAESHRVALKRAGIAMTAPAPWPRLTAPPAAA